MTHDALGEKMGGVTRQQLIKLEQAKHRPRLRTIERLAEATGRDPRWFVDPDIDPSPFPDSEADGDA